MSDVASREIRYFISESTCPYFIDRNSSSLIVEASRSVSGLLFSELLSLGFRRSGNFFYKAQCDGCSECVPIRVGLSKFILEKKFRRVLNKNADVEVVILDKPQVTDNKIELYKKYLSGKHDTHDLTDVRDLLEDLHSCYPEVIEFNYLIDGVLVGVGIVDRSLRSLSTNYFYYDPDYLKRSLGVFSVLKEIEYGQKNGYEYYYLGYWLENCSKMSYKTAYKPYQLYLNELWQEF